MYRLGVEASHRSIPTAVANPTRPFGVTQMSVGRAPEQAGCGGGAAGDGPRWACRRLPAGRFLLRFSRGQQAAAGGGAQSGGGDAGGVCVLFDADEVAAF